MKKVFISIITLMLVVGFSTTASANTNLEKSLKSNFGSANYSITLHELQTGKLKYEKNSQRLLTPASSLKLVTTAAALHNLGADYKFITTLYYSGTISKGNLNGHLYLKGEGDPTLNATKLKAFASKLKSLGIKHINGNIYADDSSFSGKQLSPGVLANYEGDDYAAPISALNLSSDSKYMANVVKVTVKPGTKVGAASAISFAPYQGNLTISNQVKTVAKGRGTSVSITRKKGTNQIIAKGQVALGTSRAADIAVHNSTNYTITAFAQELKKQGITKVKTSKIATAKVPKSAIKVTASSSPALSELTKNTLKYSNNAIADILMKKMGQQAYGIGTLDNGVKVVKQYLKNNKVSASNWIIVDGSGLSAKNKVTTKQLSQLLVVANTSKWYSQAYLPGMPVGGYSALSKGGSLNERFLSAKMKGRVLAKTGWIPGHYSLTGYVRAKSGKWYAFSVMTTKKSANPSIDRVVEKIVELY